MNLETNEKIIQITPHDKGFFALTNTGQVYKIVETDTAFNHQLVTSDSVLDNTKEFNK